MEIRLIMVLLKVSSSGDFKVPLFLIVLNKPIRARHVINEIVIQPIPDGNTCLEIGHGVESLMWNWLAFNEWSKLRFGQSSNHVGYEWLVLRLRMASELKRGNFQETRTLKSPPTTRICYFGWYTDHLSCSQLFKISLKLLLTQFSNQLSWHI